MALSPERVYVYLPQSTLGAARQPQLSVEAVFLLLSGQPQYGLRVSFLTSPGSVQPEAEGQSSHTPRTEQLSCPPAEDPTRLVPK